MKGTGAGKFLMSDVFPSTPFLCGTPAGPAGGRKGEGRATSQREFS